jgi:hypothetical protein
VDAHGSEGDREYVQALHEHLDADERQELRLWLKASGLRLGRLQAALDRPARARGAGRSGRQNSFWQRILHPFGR